VFSPRSKQKLDKAMKWEQAFITFMKEWTSNPDNIKNMDVAFNSERSIEVPNHLISLVLVNQFLKFRYLRVD
jgi:hypothetical protein